jgi:hypothetical protein
LQEGDPKSLSDDALREFCAETPTEDLLARGGCLGSIAAFLLLVVTLLIFPLWFLFLGSALMAAAFFWARNLAGRPKQRYREELKYRSGMGPWEQYVAEAEATLHQKEADWVFLFFVWGFPNKGFRWLRLDLNEGPPASAQASLRICLQLNYEVFKRVERDVPEDMVQDLLPFLKELDVAALNEVPNFADGAICRWAVLRREPWFVTSARGKMLGFTAELSQHPAAIACSKLWKITVRLAPAG